MCFFLESDSRDERTKQNWYLRSLCSKFISTELRTELSEQDKGEAGWLIIVTCTSDDWILQKRYYYFLSAKYHEKCSVFYVHLPSLKLFHAILDFTFGHGALFHKRSISFIIFKVITQILIYQNYFCKMNILIVLISCAVLVSSIGISKPEGKEEVLVKVVSPVSFVEVSNFLHIFWWDSGQKLNIVV